MDKPFGFVGWHGTLLLRRLEHLPTGAGPDQSRRPFTLIFSGPPGDVLPEGLYTAVVDGQPGATFYIMPIHTPSADRQDYQAVFN